MAIDVYKRLNYLNEITDKLIELDSSEDALRLSSFYGLTSKEICFKNLIKSFRWDQIQLKRCSRCYAHIDFNLRKLIDSNEKLTNEKLKNENLKNEKLKNKNLKNERLKNENFENKNLINLNKKVIFKIKKKHLTIECKLCKFKKSFIINSEHKTIYEKLFFRHLE